MILLQVIRIYAAKLGCDFAAVWQRVFFATMQVASLLLSDLGPEPEAA